MTEKTHETPSRWEQRKERTHRRLLEEAERLFRSQGFDAITVEEIAVAADVAKGTFFNYFESKECLLGELLYSRIQSRLSSPPAPEAPADERIRLLFQTLWEELIPYRHLARRMFAYALTHPKPEYLSPDQPTTALALADLIRAGQAQGIFRPDISPEFAGTLLTTYFFRLCVLDMVDCRIVAAGTTTDVTMDATTDTTTGATTIRGRDLIDEGLDLLYRGMLRDPTH